MSTVKNLGTAQAAKDKGNVAFKMGDFPIAIGHYTAAILADRDDHTLPLNRAAAYIKLGKNEDAERDCTTVLSLSAHNVKALFRRGQARLALGKLHDARNDLVEALNFEPANNSIQGELRKINGLLGKQKTEVPTPDTTPKRRRVPITIVDSTAAGPSNSQTTTPASKPSSITSSQILPSGKPSKDILNPVSSRSIKSQHYAISPSPSITEVLATGSFKTSVFTKEDEPRTFKDAKQTRENARPSRVGGGIFRASGDTTLFPVGAEMSSKRTLTVPSSPSASIATPLSRIDGTSAPSSTVIPKAYVTLFDFSKSWYSTSVFEDRWALISNILPANLPMLFKSSLEPSLLVDILQVFGNFVNDEERKPLLRDYMENFAKVPRFGAIVLFLSRKEKELAKQVWEGLGFGKDAVDPIWVACF